MSTATESITKPAPSQTAETLEAPAEVPYKYARFLPTFDPNFKQAPLQPFEHVDPGLEALADPTPLSFLSAATEVNDLTPDFGSEIVGLQLHLLTPHERAQLALYVAQRGVVAFRDQDFVDQPPEWQLYDFAATFGPLHVHPTSGQPAEFPEFHLVYRDGSITTNYETLNTRLTGSLWHSDVSYEAQPPGLTGLFLYSQPRTGGDTGFADQRAAYNHLSSSFRAYLETLTAVHSGVAQAEFSRSGSRGGVIKREPVENIHPVVRTHPVTGENALFVNPQFTTRIVGLKVEESDAILNLLFAHIRQGNDFHVRLTWKPRTVVLWDNRITAHTAIIDFAKSGERRHGARITAQAERPFLKKE